jgi:hypothetical protein
MPLSVGVAQLAFSRIATAQGVDISPASDQSIQETQSSQLTTSSDTTSAASNQVIESSSQASRSPPAEADVPPVSSDADTDSAANKESFSLTEEQARKLLDDEEERRKQARKKRKGRIRELEEASGMPTVSSQNCGFNQHPTRLALRLSRITSQGSIDQVNCLTLICRVDLCQYCIEGSLMQHDC